MASEQPPPLLGPKIFQSTRPLSALESWPSSSAFGMARDTGSPSPSSRNFGDFSEFLRASVADEESLQMGESLQDLSTQIESMTEEWRLPHPDGTWLAAGLLALLDALREHHRMLLDLNRDWDRFIEFKAHLVSLNQFRTNVTQWADTAQLPGAQPPLQSAFDVSAWRMLGAGALLLDVYEQSCKVEGISAEAPGSAWSRLIAWIRNGD
ncbi:MAG: hypothetical protein H7293_16570 [Candidatus Saccharibacteria bacterium]|nr:hypothetical protein [Rhodoferax sp.]